MRRSEPGAKRVARSRQARNQYVVVIIGGRAVSHEGAHHAQIARLGRFAPRDSSPYDLSTGRKGFNSLRRTDD